MGMKRKIVVHHAHEGGYWAEVPAVPGCMTQGETLEELWSNILEALAGCLSVDVSELRKDPDGGIVDAPESTPKESE